MHRIKEFIAEESGVAAIEYGLLAALIAIPLIAVAGVVGDRLTDVFTEISHALDRALR